MRSRAARMALVTVALIALGAAGYFVFALQNKITTDSVALNAADQYAREATDAIADLRVGQQAYVAPGQGVTFWMPKVGATVEAAVAAVAWMRESLTSADARAAADQASAALTEFIEVDKRAREYIRGGQTLMAGDVIFTEGGQLAGVAARQVETARQMEHQAAEAALADLRRQQVIAAGSGAGIVGLLVLLLGLAGAGAREEPEPAVVLLNRIRPDAGEEGIVSHARPTPGDAARAAAAPPTPASQRAARNSAVLKAAADLATDFGRVRDSQELARLLERAADLIDATGLIVWMGSPTGSDIRPVLTHGYAPQMMARMPPVPRTADNAAAAAYRTGTLQIVLSKPGGPAGAIVAPILGVDGCAGALSAEIRDGGEGSEAVQSLTAIVAAHLAGVLAASPAAEEPAEEQPRTAAQA